MDIALRRQLREEITVKLPGPVDTSGDPTYSASYTITVRIERKESLLYDRYGEEVHTTHFIISEEPIFEKMRIWFPGESETDATLARIPKVIEKLIDENGQVYGYLTML